MSLKAETGAIPAPPGITPDFEHPKDVLRTINYVTQALSLIFVTAFMALKYYAKVTVLRGAWVLDDCMLHSRRGFQCWASEIMKTRE